MSKVNIALPKITLDGKTYTAAKPKAKLWREMIKFNHAFAGKDLSKDDQALDQIFTLIAGAIGNPEVTPETIENGLDLDELMPKFAEICEWVARVVGGKSAELPNVQTPAEN